MWKSGGDKLPLLLSLLITTVVAAAIIGRGCAILLLLPLLCSGVCSLAATTVGNIVLELYRQPHVIEGEDEWYL